jgi:uncharacterized protein YuzE
LEAAVQILYDPEVDVLRVILRDAEIVESEEDKPGLILDFDEQGSVIAMEILDASTRVEGPRAVEYAAD